MKCRHWTAPLSSFPLRWWNSPVPRDVHGERHRCSAPQAVVRIRHNTEPSQRVPVALARGHLKGFRRCARGEVTTYVLNLPMVLESTSSEHEAPCSLEADRCPRAHVAVRFVLAGGLAPPRAKPVGSSGTAVTAAEGTTSDGSVAFHHRAQVMVIPAGEVSRRGEPLQPLDLRNALLLLLVETPVKLGLGERALAGSALHAGILELREVPLASLFEGYFRGERVGGGHLGPRGVCPLRARLPAVVVRVSRVLG